MIRSSRSLVSAATGARHEVSAWVAETARVHVMQTTGLTCDDRLYESAFGRIDQGERAIVTVVLEGRLFLESAGRCDCVEAGHAIHLPRKGALRARTEGAHYTSLVIEWDAARRRGPAHVPIERAPFADLAAVICSAASPDTATIGELEDRLRALLSLDDLRLARTRRGASRDLRAQEVADALDAVLSSLADQPMASDLERRLGVTSRQVARMVEAFRARYGYGAANWRETRNRRRLLLAATLLTADRATVSGVADEVGYQRPETLARAFALAGLPKPRAVREHVTSLRETWLAELASHSLDDAPPVVELAS